MRRDQGFILITVLAVLVLLAAVAARLDERVSAYREGQGGWQRWAEGQAALTAARDELLFAMTTNQLSRCGFGRGVRCLRVDGRPYRMSSGVLVSVQDARGLISVATPDGQVLRNHLLNQGIGDRDVAPLIDKLEDYADSDDLHRLNGAEAEQYRRLGLPPPRNDWLVSAYELRLVAGWAEHPELWSRASDVFTANRESWINPNTAPQSVLAALPGATPASVSRLIELRESRLLHSAAEVLAVSGIVVEDEPVAFFPGVFYRLRLWQEQGLGAMEYAVILTPAAPSLPWLILETRLVDRPEPRDPPRSISAFPFPLPTADQPLG